MGASLAQACGLPVMALAIGLGGPAFAADPLEGICAASELKLFACVLKTRDQVGFCLGKADQKTRFVVRSANGKQAASMAHNLRAATIGDNAHGDIVTLQAETPEGSVAIYVDFIADDQEAPVLVTTFAKQETKEPCATPDFEADPLETEGTPRAGLLGLVDNHIARPLKPVPDWPN